MEREVELIHAVDAAFHSTGIDAFIRGLNQRGARIASIEEASSDLTVFLPDSVSNPGDTFVISFLIEYQSLDAAARNRVESRYKSLVGAVPEELKRKYPRVLRYPKGYPEQGKVVAIR